MGFLDKAKAAASDLAAKADTALASSGVSVPGVGGDADKLFHDLGVLAYLEGTGRAFSVEERARVGAALNELEARGAIRSFALKTTPPVAPPPPGAAAAGAVPPPPGAMAPPPPGAMAPPPPGAMAPPPGAMAPPPGVGVEPEQAAPATPAAPAQPAAPPPPPSWA